MDYQVVTDFELEQNKSGWTLTKYVGFDVENMEIPSEIDGKKITIVGKSVFVGLKTYNIKIAKGIEKIEQEAFSNGYIETIILPDTLKSIGKGAFKDCWSLKQITIPKKVTQILDEAFYGCPNTEIVFEAAFDQLPNDTSSIDRHTLIIPKTIKKIGEQAFDDCNYRDVIILPECQSSLGCFIVGTIVGERKIFIPATVTKIDVDIDTDFYDATCVYCEAGSVAMSIARKIGVDCHNYSENLNAAIASATKTKAKIKEEQEEQKRIEEQQKKEKEEEAKRLEEEAKRKEAEKPYTLTNIERDEHLRTKNKPQDKNESGYEYVISKNVKVIKYGAFIGYSRSIILFEEGSQLEKIEKGAFDDCFKAWCYQCGKTFVLPPSVKLIEKGAFRNCEYLYKIKIPSTCKVEEGAFTKQYSHQRATKIIYYNPSQGGDNSDNNSGILGKLKSLFKKIINKWRTNNADD